MMSQKPIKKTLPNGLRVILLESHAAPVVSWNLWANVGSVNETPQEAGLCHLIEHMLFKGTSRRAVGQIAGEVEAAGGDMNAYTSFDETVFYINMSSRKMDVGLDILADAATDPTFDEEELKKEKEVVVEEISRAEDNPSQMVGQDLFQSAFQVHTYGRPIAGNRDTVRGVSRDTLMQFYKKWYVASNLIFIGVGDFKTEEVLSKIETLFSKIPAGTAPQQTIPSEPVSTQPRVITRAMDVEGHYLDLGFPIPGLGHADVPGLDVLSHVLGGGVSSRLEQNIKEKKNLVVSIGSYAYTPRYPCLMIIGAVLKDKQLKETLQAIGEEIENLKHTPPSLMEVTRAKENIRSSRIYERQTVEALARKIGYFEGIANNLDYEEDYYRQVASITPEEIQRLAQTYLSLEKITCAFCHSKKESWSVKKICTWLPQESSVSPKKLSNKKSETHSFKLSNGIRVLVRENHSLPLIAMKSASLGSLRLETEKNNGITHLVSLLQTKGTHHRTAREIAEATENLSGHLDGYMGRHLLGLSSSFLSDKITEALELFFDLLLHPSFPEDEIKKEKGQVLTSIRNEEDSLAHVAMKKFLSGLYGKHPYGFPILGIPKTVRSFQRKDLIHFYHEMIRPDNLVLSVVGDVDVQDIRERLENKLVPWQSGYVSKKSHKKIQAFKQPKQPVIIETKKKKLQAHIVYGFPGTTVTHADKYPLEVLSFVLSGQGGRLFLELRDKQALAYAISASSHEGIESGYFSVYMGTDASKLETALEGIKIELGKISSSLVSPEELERAKRFIIGNYELDLQKNSSVASLLVLQEIYGLSSNELYQFPQKIERVTQGDVLRVARKYLRPEHSVLSVVKP